MCILNNIQLNFNLVSNHTRQYLRTRNRVGLDPTNKLQRPNNPPPQNIFIHIHWDKQEGDGGEKLRLPPPSKPPTNALLLLLLSSCCRATYHYSSPACD